MIPVCSQTLNFLCVYSHRHFGMFSYLSGLYSDSGDMKMPMCLQYTSSLPVKVYSLKELLNQIIVLFFVRLHSYQTMKFSRKTLLDITINIAYFWKVMKMNWWISLSKIINRNLEWAFEVIVQMPFLGL